MLEDFHRTRASGLSERARIATGIAATLSLLQAAPAPIGAEELSSGGYSIFHETMVDMSYDEVEKAAQGGAIVLWPLGVIEEHGPHLPLGTDIYNAYLQMKRVARLLRERDISAVIAPPLYWGINEATGAFGGSFTLRPATLEALVEDTFASLRKDGFRAVYLITGHGDQLHNRTIVDAVRKARATTGMRGYVVIDERMRERLAVEGSEPHLLVTPNVFGGEPGAAPPRFLEVHAGAGETSVVWRYFPDLVEAELIPKLEPTRYGPDDLAEWRQGWDDARAKTPLGYFGDPAAANRERGAASFERGAQLVAEAIVKELQSAAWNR